MLRLTTSTPGIRWLHHCAPQEREASASLFQVYHSQRESLFQRAQSIFSKYGKHVAWMSQKRKSNQELDNRQFRIILEREQEQLFAEALSEILRHEYRADLAENNICELKRQIDSQAVEIGHTRTGYEQSRREQALLHEELTDRERALRETRVGSIQKLEDFKRDQEFRLEKFPIRKLVENHFEDVESVRSGQLFHVPSNQRYFLFLVNQEDCWAATKICSQIYGIRMVFRETFLQIHSVSLDNLLRTVQSLELISQLRNIPVQTSIGQPVMESGWWSRPQPILSENGKKSKQFLIFQFQFWFLKRPSTGILTLFQKECI